MENLKILSWNIRGFKSSKNRSNLKYLILKWNPTIVCIQETLMSAIEDKDLENLWPQKKVKAIYQSAMGHSGGILCCWDPLLVEISQFLSIKACLGISFKDMGSGLNFHTFIVYGPHSSTDKVILWNRLSGFNNLSLNSPSVFIGDFNCTRTQIERVSCQGNSWDSEIFDKWITRSNLIDLQIDNCKFTWIGPNGKRSKLDRALVNANWAQLGNWRLQALPRKNSDHKPLLLYYLYSDWGPKPFRVFNTWLKEISLQKDSKEFLSTSGLRQNNIQQKLRSCKEVIRKWNKGVNGIIFRKIEEVESKLAILEENAGEENELIVTRMELEELNLKKDHMLLQQSRIQWLKEGDRNSQFFHQVIQKRRARNTITQLK